MIKNSPADAGRHKRGKFDPEVGKIPWRRIQAGGRHPGNPLQCSCLENPTHRGTWQATVHGVAKNWTQLSDLTFRHRHFQD